MSDETLVHCPACHHDFAPLSAISALVICPKCFRTLTIRDCCASPATGANLDGVEHGVIVALKKQRSALRKAAQS